jgi:oligopeptide transport system substrate-binding protein
MLIKILLLAIALGSGAALAEEPRELRIQLPSEPVSLDPAAASDDFAARVLANTMEGLFGYDGAGKLEKLLASSYELSPDHRTYTFVLRKGARWSDGEPVTAGDFVLGIRRTLDPRTGAYLANLLYPIRGARGFNRGTATAESVGVRAQGDGRLVIELEKPAPYFLHVLALSQAAPARADILAASGGKWPENAPVTGPYFIDSHVLEKEIHLSPNPRHWRYRKTWLPVELMIVPEETTAQSLFESGKLDVVTRIAPQDYPRFKAKGAVRVFPQAATYFLTFNARKAPFNDRVVRRAVAGSLRREEMVAAIESPQRLADGWIPPELLPHRRYKYDSRAFAGSVTKIAEQVAAQPLAVTAAFSSNATNSILMEKLQFDLSKTLGIRTTLDSLDWKTFIGLVRSDTPQIYRFQRGAPFMDPVWHLVSFKGDDANNFTGWKNSEYDALVDQVTELPDGPKRRSAIEKAEKILIEDDAIVVPLLFVNQIFLVSERVKGFRANPINVSLFSEMSIK